MLVPYNESQFHLMFKYPTLFEKLWKEEQEEDLQGLKREEEMLKDHSLGKKHEKVKQKKKLQKVIYHINILPSVSQDQGQLMEAIAVSNELDIFRTDCV